MLPYFPPSPEWLAFACQTVGEDMMIFTRSYGFRAATYSRDQAFVAGRIKVWVFCRSAWGWSLPEIGRASGCNHSTIITALMRTGWTRARCTEYRAELLEDYGGIQKDEHPVDRMRVPVNVPPAHGPLCKCTKCYQAISLAMKMYDRGVGVNDVVDHLRPYYRHVARMAERRVG